MNLFLKSLLCGIIALNAYSFAQEDPQDEEVFDEEFYREEYRAEMRCPRQYVMRFVPYYPEGDSLREKREESRWPSKRNFELFDRLSQ